MPAGRGPPYIAKGRCPYLWPPGDEHGRTKKLKAEFMLFFMAGAKHAYFNLLQIYSVKHLNIQQKNEAKNMKKNTALQRLLSELEKKGNIGLSDIGRKSIWDMPTWNVNPL